MVFIESKKYACETCIKGHRSSACKHTDRPLFEIKKKGRPVTQCEHCRELRKTKQVHVKCICEIKNDPNNISKKVGAKAPDSAAFPNGLPEALALEASVASIDPRTTASDPSLPSGVALPCSCMTGVCHCWTPRKSAPRPRRKTDSALAATVTKPPTTPTTISQGSDIHTPQTEFPPPAASHILARISELRPVLPRPSVHHEPSSGIAHGHGNRHHHENAFFSPYGRAYDINHLHVPPVAIELSSYDAPAPPKTQIHDRAIANSIPIMNGSTSNPENTLVNFPSSCTCGDGCRCPGCYHHNSAASAASPSAYATCLNPGACNACLDCTILALPPDTALSIPEPLQAEAIDEWIRQVQANPDSMIMATNSNDNDGNVIDDGRFAGWDSLAQLATGCTQCATCNSFICTCGKEVATGDRRRHEMANGDPACCDKPKLSSVGINVQGQGGYESSDFLDYSVLGMNDVYLDSAMEVFPSRSPSSPSNNSNPDTFSQMLSTSFAYPALVEKMSPSQQSMYINGRGFYSDPYLSMSSNERTVDNFGVLDTSAPFMPMQVSNLQYPVSNPDSDTSSYDSIDDFGPLPLSRQPSDKAPRMSVSPVPSEGMRTLY